MRRYRAPADGVTAYLWERLGNQLFVWAAALAQARRLDVPCHGNLSFYRHERPRRDYAKNFALGSFDHGLSISADDAAHVPLFLGLPAVPPAVAWHRHVRPRLPRAVVGPAVYMEPSFRYDPAIERVTPGTTVVGLFQSWRYFDVISDEVRARMESLTDPSPWFRTMTDRLRPGSGAILLHLRRADYLQPAQQRVQGLTTRAYYAEALRLLRASGLDGPVFVSSDSLPVAMRELEGLADNLTPIDLPAGVEPYELLVLLSRADAFVAANSTFSWWAAYLGTRPGRPVIAPRPWFTDASIDTQDLFPGEWLTLGRQEDTFSRRFVAAPKADAAP